jgi:glycosyltransferase involved in cell wall biosynthesis
MKVAFYSPLKPPGHAVPSGDRLMARLLVQCLTRAGHDVDVISQLRSFLRDPLDAVAHAQITAQAEGEIAHLTKLWEKVGPPDLWFCYHPYYKAPDLIGPSLCESFGVPYVTAEASYSARRNKGLWVPFQAGVLAGVQQAAVNICLTKRDHDGLLQAAPTARLARLRPFIEASPFMAAKVPVVGRLVTVAMMRAGDKMDSYIRLAASLRLIADRNWSLSVIGDGALRREVHALFAEFAPDRVTWHGQKSSPEIAELLAQSDLYVWPGCGEAYGLAYLEAQAAGLPVLAYRTGGVPEVVADGETGILTPLGDDAAYADAIAHLLDHPAERLRMGQAARRQVLQFHSAEAAVEALNGILHEFVRKQA